MYTETIGGTAAEHGEAVYNPLAMWWRISSRLLLGKTIFYCRGTHKSSRTQPTKAPHYDCTTARGRNFMWNATQQGARRCPGSPCPFSLYCRAHLSVKRFSQPPNESLAQLFASKFCLDRATTAIVFLPLFRRAALASRLCGSRAHTHGLSRESSSFAIDRAG